MDLFKNSESDPLFGKQFQGLLPAPWPTCTVAIISLTVLSLGVGCTYRMLRRRRRKRAKLATMTASRQECGTREYVEDAIREAFVLVGVFNACTPSQLPNVLEVAMGRSPSEQETSAVLAACSHSGQTAFTPSIVCDAFLATKDSALVSAAVRTQRDHDFMRAHHGRTHRQVLRSMLCSVWYFSLLNVLLLPASLLALLYALLEVATSDGAYLGASGFAAGAAICLLMSAVGIRAMCLVRGDLRRADDGRTTRAQRLAELWFWVMLCATIVIVLLTIFLGILPLVNDTPGRLVQTVGRAPAKLMSLAQQFGMVTGAGTGAVGAAESTLRSILFAGTVAGCATSLGLLLGLVAAARIATVYEIVEGFMLFAAFLFTLAGAVLAYSGGLGLAFTTIQTGRVPMPDSLKLGLLVVFGAGGGHSEPHRTDEPHRPLVPQ